LEVADRDLEICVVGGALEVRFAAVPELPEGIEI